MNGLGRCGDDSKSDLSNYGRLESLKEMKEMNEITQKSVLL
jgi:hypothetical protein